MGYLPYDVNVKTIIWTITLIYLGIIAALLFIKSRKVELKSLRDTQHAYGFFLLFYITQRIFFILSDYQRDAYGETVLYYRLVVLGYIFIILSFLNIIYILEKHVITKTKYIITILILCFSGINTILFFFPNLIEIVRYLNYFLLYGEVILLLIIYIYISIKTTGKPRKKAILIFVGILIMIIGSILDSDALIKSGLVLPFYTPLLIAMGVTFFGYVQIKMD
jgi:hypothetical protein